MEHHFPDEYDVASDYYMNTLELKEIYEAGMVLGSHSVNHYVMSKLSYSEQELEIRKSFEFIEGIVGTSTLRTFCYPYGGNHSFNEDTVQILSKLDCNFSFNVEPRDINSDDLKNHPQALPRYYCNFF